MVRPLLGVIVLGLLAAPPAARAKQGWTDIVAEDGYVGPVPKCSPKHFSPREPHPSPREPYVPNPATAKAIFLAVEAAKVPKADKAHFPLVDVFDRGGRWVVFRHGTEVVGGGQLELEISKCTGRIYRADFGV